MTLKHILACDERGTKSLTSNSNTFTIGGFATRESSRPYLTNTWLKIKKTLCEDSSLELKWMHFFPGHHQSRIQNPLMQTPNGNTIISVFQLFGGVLGQFALYLKENRGKNGEIWFDQLGSRKEEAELQAQISKLFKNLALPDDANQRLGKRINPQINFIDSEKEPLIQLADFVSGVIWASAEGDDWFFRKLLEKYAPGKRRTYGILLLEA